MFKKCVSRLDDASKTAEQLVIDLQLPDVEEPPPPQDKTSASGAIAKLVFIQDAYTIRFES